MSSQMTPGWSFSCNDYRSFLNFRDRESCLIHAFDTALASKLPAIVLKHPDGTEEVVTRAQYERTKW